MKAQQIWATVIGLISVAVYIEKFYQHPTLGNGLRAFVAAVTVGKLA